MPWHKTLPDTEYTLFSCLQKVAEYLGRILINRPDVLRHRLCGVRPAGRRAAGQPPHTARVLQHSP